MKKELKGISFDYNRENQTLTIETFNRFEADGTKEYTGKIIVNKTYMFSIFIMISQIMRRMFMHKSVVAKLNKEK